jgi:hypothetical protein
MTPRIAGLQSLPKKVASFIEPMDCEPVSILREGSEWLYVGYVVLKIADVFRSVHCDRSFRLETNAQNLP